MFSAVYSKLSKGVVLGLEIDADRYSTADTCTSHGDAFVDPAGAPTLHNYETASGVVVDAGSAFTSFLCQECTGCA